KIYGGFAGTEYTLEDRNLDLIHTDNKTILSGDLDENDDGTLASKADNAYHVFYHPLGLGLSTTAVLDGFTLTGGYASAGIIGESAAFSQGAGMYNNSASPTLRNLII